MAKNGMSLSPKFSQVIVFIHISYFVAMFGHQLIYSRFAVLDESLYGSYLSK